MNRLERTAAHHAYDQFHQRMRDLEDLYDTDISKETKISIQVVVQEMDKDMAWLYGLAKSPLVEE